MDRLEQRYYILRQGQVLIRKGNTDIRPLTEDGKALCSGAETILPLSKGQKNRDFAVQLHPDTEPGPGFEWIPLRSLVGRLDAASFDRWGRAAQILNWQKTHRYCGACGAATVEHPSELARVCPSCSLTWYPRIAPCIIVLIARGKEILLARSPHFRPGMYSTLAGFIEPGESVESTMQREISEEVAIRIKNFRYFGSQPWPFPGQLMLGFFADYDSGEIQIDGVEISDAGWYRAENLPLIPEEGTIAGRMIRCHLAGDEVSNR
ncbi:MAG: NAD(+) diphosphatase [Desulfocapsaceae bacterium]|nr:NAD(+) diphosphatase [Desulfocapsaceae bacterium]